MLPLDCGLRGASVSKKLLPRRLKAGDEGNCESVSIVRSVRDGRGFFGCVRRVSKVNPSSAELVNGGSWSTATSSLSLSSGEKAPRVEAAGEPWPNWPEGCRRGTGGLLNGPSRAAWPSLSCEVACLGPRDVLLVLALRSRRLFCELTGGALDLWVFRIVEVVLSCSLEGVARSRGFRALPFPAVADWIGRPRVNSGGC